MIMFLWEVVKVAVNAVVNFFSGIFGEWMRMQSSRQRGKAEARNEAHEKNARKRAAADEILQQPVKTGSDLTDSIRKRNKSKSD